MRRYYDANEQIHVPEKVCQRVLNIRRRVPGWVPVVAAVTAAAILLGVVFLPRMMDNLTSRNGDNDTPATGGSSDSNSSDSNSSDSGSSDSNSSDGGSYVLLSEHAISEAQYPEMAKYPDESAYYDDNGEFDDDAFQEVFDAWWSDCYNRRAMPTDYADAVREFIAASVPEMLGNADGKNMVYSPVNVYIALSMLAELTDNESRQQILDVLGVDSVETLRRYVTDMWNANYSDDGAFTSILADSVWLNDSVTFNQDTMDTLSDTYYASSYSGEMGSEELNSALRAWIDQQTGGLLSDQASGVELSADTILALVTTVYFKARWASEFYADSNTQDVFHTGGDSGDITVEYMHASPTATYYWGESFGAIKRSFTSGYGSDMWFILPDEGVSPEQLLYDSELYELLSAYGEWENSKTLIINESIPKFDVSSGYGLSDGLRNLGITDVFDAEVSDFSPMTGDTDEMYLSQATHAARVKIDEEGVTAAAFTEMSYAGAAMPPDDEMDFTLDRPFLFVITGCDGLPLFIGIVNQP